MCLENAKDYISAFEMSYIIDVKSTFVMNRSRKLVVGKVHLWGYKSYIHDRKSRIFLWDISSILMIHVGYNRKSYISDRKSRTFLMGYYHLRRRLFIIHVLSFKPYISDRV